MNKNLLLHIGLHKTGTTFLQQLIFKKISKDYNLKSNLIDNSISAEILEKLSLFKSNINCLSSLEKINLQNGIISHESLCAPRSNPAYYELLRNFNYKMFGAKAHVLIVIRKPSEFLRLSSIVRISSSIWLNFSSSLSIKLKSFVFSISEL